MMFFRYFVFAVTIVCLASIVQPGHSYRILCVFPAPSISHQVVFRGLTLALNKRGHELVVVTPDPINDAALTNYTEIDVSFVYNKFAELNVNYIEHRSKKMKWLYWTEQASGFVFNLLDQILDHPELRELYASDSNEKFDLLLVELTCWQSVYPLATRFNIPMIGISSLALGLNDVYTIGNPVMPSHPSNWELESEISEQLSFWQRLRNFITVWRYLYWYKTTFMPEQQAIARKYFGDDITDLADLHKNVSLIFVNQQGPISYTLPTIPKVIEIGGFHISKENMNIPKDLKKFLDQATEGFVYVSLGSNVKSTTLPKETLNKFRTAFSRLPYQVLWKFEDDVLPDKPSNVYIMKWVPQQAVLAHPNLKVFLYQGGLQSTEEAVSHSVPLIGLPVFADQDMQVNKMVSLGVAKKLEITAIDENELFDVITTVASDIGYKQRMLNLRSLINDKPHDPLENAVWWTEYVIRHRGVPHLHSTTANEPWYSRQDMDIVAFISAGSVVALILTLAVLYQSVKRIYYIYMIRSHDTKKKN